MRVQVSRLNDTVVLSMTSTCGGRSTAPTPFAGYSFHVAEAALVFANEITVVFLFPIHAGLHRVYHLATTAIHIGAHTEACTTCSICPLNGDCRRTLMYDVQSRDWELCHYHARAVCASVMTATAWSG